MKKTNPPGKWEHTATKFGHRFVSYEISSLYGFVVRDLERENHEFPFYWEARTLLSARASVASSAVSGYVPSVEAGKRIVETILKETNTVEFPE